jgi:hypothetical protein
MMRKNKPKYLLLMIKKKFFRQNDLEEAFEEIFTTNDPKKIITILGENQIDVVMLDMNYRILKMDAKAFIGSKK